MRPKRRVRISRKAVVAQDTCCFELVDVDSGWIRQYSSCNDSAETTRYMIAVLRDAGSRGGSAAMHALRERQTLWISDPSNLFPLEWATAHHMLLADGVGVTPILCMGEQLATSGASFDMQFCARSAQRTAFVDRIRGSRFAYRVRFYFDDDDPGQKLDIDTALRDAPRDTHLYVCRPTGFMDWVLSSARTAGWPEAQLHVRISRLRRPIPARTAASRCRSLRPVP